MIAGIGPGIKVGDTEMIVVEKDTTWTYIEETTKGTYPFAVTIDNEVLMLGNGWHMYYR